MDIRTIPDIMRRAHGWTVAPALMERWFGLPPNSVPERGQTDRTSVTMNWALSFTRAREAYDQMVRNRVWLNMASRQRIDRWLAGQNKYTNSPETFGISDFSRATWRELLDGCICSRSVGGISDPRDDMYGALGEFDFRVVVSGEVRPANTLPMKAHPVSPARQPSMRSSVHSTGITGHVVYITRIGIYLWDSYDFNGSQFLGCWNSQGVSSASLSSDDYVHNSNFQDWRAANNHGGDFCIYSDVRQIGGAPSDTFDV